MELKFLESDLEGIIFNAPEGLLAESGLEEEYKQIYRQVNLGKYGIADLISVNYHKDNTPIEITIFELKNHKIDISALLQVSRYLKGVKEFVKYNTEHDLPEFDFKIVLIGREIDTMSNFVFLNECIPNLSCYTYSYDYDGIHFERKSGYYVPDNKFPESLISTFLSAKQKAKKTILFNVRNDI